MAEDFSKVLITGAEGVVGNYADFGVKTDRSSMDITSLDSVLSVCRQHKPTAIIHLAAATDLAKCESDPQYAYSINSIGTYNVALAAKEIGAKMVYVSTSGIFDGKKKIPYAEDDEPNPQNYYARSKHLGEVIVKEILKDYLIVRTCWVFGGGVQKDKKFVSRIIEQLSQPEIKAVVDQIGSPTYAKDLMIGIKELIRRGETGIVHLANKGSCSRYELAKTIAEMISPEIKVKPVSSGYFKSIGFLQSVSSRVDVMRPWHEALREYIEKECKPFLNLK
ncbi:MAG: NAD(P)-dependent oxidoreductase [Candidatus Paceibacterota bacterium]|jgi:dTDP-4-dehydrorhamnose reductase